MQLDMLINQYRSFDRSDLLFESREMQEAIDFRSIDEKGKVLFEMSLCSGSFTRWLLSAAEFQPAEARRPN